MTATATLAPCTACGGPRQKGNGAHGWCGACTQRWYRAGKPDDGPPTSWTERCQEYDWLREQGLPPLDAAARLNISPHAAARQERRRGKAGLPMQRVLLPKYMVTCKSCGEDGEHRGRGWCIACYTRWYKAGKPEGGPPPLDLAARDRAHSERATNRRALEAAVREAGWEWVA